MSTTLRRLALPWLLGVPASLLVAEVVTRVGNPTPRSQVIDLRSETLIQVDEHPVWVDPYHTPPEDCRDPSPRSILVVGDSIAVVGASAVDSLGPRLVERLSEAWNEPVCLRLAAAPGLPVEGQAALARHLDPHAESDLLILLLWRASGASVVAGHWWIETTQMATDPEGWPLPPFPLPSAWHATLLAHSALWRYATLALARPLPVDIQADTRTHRTLFSWAREHQMPVLLAEMPPLDRPFGSPWGRSVWLEELRATWTAGDLPWVDVSAELASRGADVEALRLDTCCHYNPAGHEAVAEILAQAALRVLTPHVDASTPAHLSPPDTADP